MVTMTLLRSCGLVLLTAFSVHVSTARDVSLYPFFEFAPAADDAAVLQEAGLDPAHVAEHHPANHGVPALRDAMMGIEATPAGEAAAQPLSTLTTVQAPPLQLQQPVVPKQAVASTNDVVSTPLGATSVVNGMSQQPGVPRLQQQGRSIVGSTGGLRATNAPPPQQLAPKQRPSFNNLQEKPPLASRALVNGALPPQQQQQHPPAAGTRVASLQASQQQQTAATVGAASGAPEDQPKAQFDFIVGGFPKCGTTTLLKAFEAHPDTYMSPSEQCAVAAPGLADPIVLQKLDDTLAGMSSASHDTKRAFKCPTAMYNYKSVIRMEKHSPSSKFVVGIRHPVNMMQSFFNYRVTEIYERGLSGQEEIPDFMDLVSVDVSPPWKGVGMASVRFDLFLKQLGKTVVTPEDMIEFSKYTSAGYELAIKPSNFTVFLYTVAQLEDSDEERSGNLLAAMQNYLGLATPLEPFGHENKNYANPATGDSGHPESIYICDPKYTAVRERLVVEGVKTAAWLRDHFLKSPDVIVANPDHFVETLEAWGIDPCDATAPDITVEAETDEMEAKFEVIEQVELSSEVEAQI